MANSVKVAWEAHRGFWVFTQKLFKYRAPVGLRDEFTISINIVLIVYKTLQSVSSLTLITLLYISAH